VAFEAAPVYRRGMAVTHGVDPSAWLSGRARRIDASGIRRVFELGAKLKNPYNFSIGQPDFPVPDAMKEAAIAAIRADRNGYTVTQGIPELSRRVAAHLAEDVGWALPSADLAMLITSGTSGALHLAFQALLDAGDEVIAGDPYFVAYPAVATLAGAKFVRCDTYPDGRLTAERIEPLITDRTKIVLVNSPSNPAGAVLSADELRAIVSLCDRRGILLMSDEIYDRFTYTDALEDGRCPSAARLSERVLLIRGFGKTYGCTGWRLGYAAGPRTVIEAMTRLQQYTFVCAPSMAQAGAIAAFDIDMSGYVNAYERKRDMVLRALSPVTDVVRPGGAFYAFVKVPERLGLTASQFVERAIERNVLVIPGNVFSARDTHFRLSYATSDEHLTGGLAVLAAMMRGE